MPEPRATTSPQSARTPNAIACLNCRSKHVKCDLQVPSCRRCTRSGLSCTYHKSRRGQRSSQQSADCTASTATSPSEREPTRHSTTTKPCDHVRQAALLDIASCMEPGLPLEGFNGGMLSFGHSMSTNSSQSCSTDGFGIFSDPWTTPTFAFSNAFDSLGSCVTQAGNQCNSLPPSCQPPTHSSSGDKSGESLIALFYKHFHPAHPFMLPYRQHVQRRLLIPLPVQIAMQFAGSHFTNTPGQQWAHCPATELDLGGSGESFYVVQGLLILAIVYYGRNETPQSVVMLHKARSMALKLHLYDPLTVSLIAQKDWVIEESVSRTWWELGNTIALMSVFNPSVEANKFELPESELHLPCEEKEYRECYIPRKRKTQQDFLDRAFSNDGFEFSSFAYKIESARLLMSIQALGHDWWSIEKDRITTVDNCLSNYHLSIPYRKRDVMGRDGTVDEVLFAAKVLTSVAIILISRPRSGLISSKEKPQTICTESIADVAYETSSQFTFQAVQAAHGLADAAGTRTSPCAVMCHSPFYTCAMALASIVHLPAYAQTEPRTSKDSIKERIKLTTNTLARIGENWPVAKVVETQILDVARDVLGCKQSSGQCSAATSDAGSSSALPTHIFHADWPDQFLRAPDFLNTMTS